MGVFRSKFSQAALIVVLAFLFFRYGIQPPAPRSVLSLYMTVVLIAVLVYVSSNGDSWRAFLAPIRSTLVDDGRRPIRFALMVLLPLLFGYYAYTQAAATIEAPAELRAIHPAPPAAAPAALGMSSSLTSTVPPSDSRNAVSAQTSERFSPMGGRSTFGMMLGYPSTT